MQLLEKNPVCYSYREEEVFVYVEGLLFKQGSSLRDKNGIELHKKDPDPGFNPKT